MSGECIMRIEGRSHLTCSNLRWLRLRLWNGIDDLMCTTLLSILLATVCFIMIVTTIMGTFSITTDISTTTTMKNTTYMSIMASMTTATTTSTAQDFQIVQRELDAIE